MLDESFAPNAHRAQYDLAHGANPQANGTAPAPLSTSLRIQFAEQLGCLFTETISELAWE